LLSLLITERLLAAYDQAGVAVVLDQTLHENAGGVIGLRGGRGRIQRRQAAPEIERIRQALVPDFLGQKYLARQRRARPETRISPADQFVVLNDMLEMRGI
jgi:hypothetical protein